MVRAFHKGILILFTLLLLSAAVNAADYSVTARAVQNSITTDEQATFEVEIENTQSKADTIRISSPDVLWNVQSDPLYYYFSGVDLEAGESKKVVLLVDPSGTAPAGQYRVDLTFTSKNTGEKMAVPINVYIKSSIPLIRDYFAAVAKLLEMPPNIDPREDVLIKINLENKNPKNISALRIGLSSNLINDEVVTSLSPLQKKSIEIKAKLDPLTEPQQDTMIVTLIADNVTLTPVLKDSFRIIEYSDIIADSPDPKKGFLKTTTTTTYTNDGNVDAKKLVEVKTNFFEKLFIRAEPRPFTINKKEGKFVAWQLSLTPQESITITVVRNYRPLFVLLVVLIIAAILYRIFRSPVIIRKDASVLSFKEGGISEVKILLHIINRTQGKFERLTVVDKLPYITDVEKDIEIGTLKPSKIYQDGKGTVIRWEIDGLDRNEERVLSYRMRSKLSILGGFTLPRSSIHFYNEKGAKFSTRSKRIKISA